MPQCLYHNIVPRVEMAGHDALWPVLCWPVKFHGLGHAVSLVVRVWPSTAHRHAMGCAVPCCTFHGLGWAVPTYRPYLMVFLDLELYNDIYCSQPRPCMPTFMNWVFSLEKRIIACKK